ncbi:MAG TPA: GNAT family N-acetyltransferase [Pyrinomonadaceae bacterium]|jgi:ribosomal-protein-alanine N-acetyltransferase|nr:GNAT family N-acetyltransferase [Pyrinomonadaceae bacterium]
MTSLETERLILRQYNFADRAASAALFTDPEVMKFVGDGVRSRGEADRLFERIFTDVYAPRAFDVWAVISKPDGAFVGHAEIKPRKDALAAPGDFEIIYVLNKAHWGRGLATELARRILQYGFMELKLNRIHATVDPENVASIRVLEKLKMVYEGEFEDEGGKTLVYVIKAEDSES